MKKSDIEERHFAIQEIESLEGAMRELSGFGHTGKFVKFRIWFHEVEISYPVLKRALAEEIEIQRKRISDMGIEL